MKLNGISVKTCIKEAEKILEEDKSISSAARSVFNLMILLITLLANRFKLNSKNSSTPPSKDQNRKKKSKRGKSEKKPGGQNGHIGAKLKKIENPDEIEVLKLDKRTLPKGHQYKDVGYETRQVIDLVFNGKLPSFMNSG